MSAQMTRAEVSPCARVMLPAFVIGFAWIGFGWMLAEPATVAATPALAYADSVVPMFGWGLLLTDVAVVILAAMLSRRRLPCRIALWVAVVVMAVFVGVFALASALGEATIAAAAWPFLAGCACYAADRSLLEGETH